MTADVRSTFFQWAATANLNHLVVFHNEMRRLLKEALRSLDTRELSVIDRKLARAAYRQFDAMLQVNTFLLLYSHLEEWLFHLCAEVRARPDPKRSGIERFKAPLRALNADLLGPNWQFLVDAGKVRHCLLHANGRITLSRNRMDIENLLQRHPRELGVALDRLVLKPAFLQRTVAQIDVFVRNARPAA
jgi:hypothetical protein